MRLSVQMLSVKIIALLGLLGCSSTAELAEAPPADGFVTRVVSFTPGDCAGFGAQSLPQVVEGPPKGAGGLSGGLDVLSLGVGGQIVLSFEPDEIVDGDGADFIVFENAFFAGGDPTKPNANLASVSVSEDGVTWTEFPCTARTYPYGSCAGWHPVYSNPDNAISPFDAEHAGGDAFDLRDIGVARARFIRIVDLGSEECPASTAEKYPTAGFDLDAISIVHRAPVK